MELRVTVQSGSNVTIRKQEYVLNVSPFDTNIRGIQSSILTAKGQIVVGLGAGSAGVLDPGTAGQSLSPNPATPTGLEWIAGSGASVSTLTNKSGVTLNAGDVVVLHPTDDRSVTTTTLAADMAVVGVVQEEIFNTLSGAVATFAGHVVLVNCDSPAIAKGNYLQTSTTAKLATASVFQNYGSFARALTSKGTGVGTVYAMLLPLSPQIINPTVYSSMWTWLRAEDLVGVTEGGSINTWLDSSPRADNYIKGTDPAPVANLNSLNGYTGARFASTTKLLQTTSTPPATGANPYTGFIVGTKVGTTTTGMLWGWGTATAYGRTLWAWGVGTNLATHLNYYTATLNGVTNATLDQARVYAVRYTGATLSMHLNNALINSVNVALNLGSSQPGMYAYDTRMFELLAFNRSLSDLEMSSVFQYLGNKFGITQTP